MPPTFDELTTISAQARPLQDKFARDWFVKIQDSANFEDVCRRSAEQAKKANVELTLLDEDGESMIAFGTMLRDERSVTFTAHWDDEIGVNLSCVFRGPQGRLAFVLSVEDGVVVTSALPE